MTQLNTIQPKRLFSDAVIQAIWEQSTPIENRLDYASDSQGVTIYRHLSGSKEPFGWEIYIPHQLRHGNLYLIDFSQLKPLHWLEHRVITHFEGKPNKAA